MSTSLMRAEISTVVSSQSLYRSSKVQAVHCDMPFARIQASMGAPKPPMTAAR